jgi:excisionase family DNA binding protein
MTEVPSTPSDGATPSYSTADVARRLGVSVPTVRRWIDEGHLKAWKTPGGHRRVDAESADAMFNAQKLPSDGAPPTSAPPAAPTVVIVDDSPDDRDLMVLLCQAAFPGCQVTAVENGFLGLMAIGQSAPDIVIADIVMPNMNGAEMLAQISLRTPVRPRLMLAVSSQSPQEALHGAGLPEGVQFLAKPLDPLRFVNALRAGLGRRA